MRLPKVVNNDDLRGISIITAFTFCYMPGQKNRAMSVLGYLISIMHGRDFKVIQTYHTL